ncbi:hypothetical protein T12_5010 [Trichinella patagoniensis]|uniref:Uncharacterized protein n=1 Tax=Trichinella patagoniensis TaxID=990121 RepID=A0A0V0ZZP6_9BILA|nr:hypothetical protein T12_15457 [Trichinella patagoniensis]KRY17970.1 hypothetical protein T12_5010 [Trichinella patagoniensis]
MYTIETKPVEAAINDQRKPLLAWANFDLGQLIKTVVRPSTTVNKRMSHTSKRWSIDIGRLVTSGRIMDGEAACPTMTATIRLRKILILILLFSTHNFQLMIALLFLVLFKKCIPSFPLLDHHLLFITRLKFPFSFLEKRIFTDFNFEIMSVLVAPCNTECRQTLVSDLFAWHRFSKVRKEPETID